MIRAFFRVWLYLGCDYAFLIPSRRRNRLRSLVPTNLAELSGAPTAVGADAGVDTVVVAGVSALAAKAISVSAIISIFFIVVAYDIKIE